MYKTYRFEVPIAGFWVAQQVCPSLIPSSVKVAHGHKLGHAEFWLPIETEAAVTRYFKIYGTGQSVAEEALYLGTTDRELDLV